VPSEIAESLRALADAVEADPDTNFTLDLDIYYPSRITQEALVELAKRPWLQQWPGDSSQRHVKITIHYPGPTATGLASL
jgi:hypothetical protein